MTICAACGKEAEAVAYSRIGMTQLEVALSKLTMVEADYIRERNRAAELEGRLAMAEEALTGIREILANLPDEEGET